MAIIHTRITDRQDAGSTLDAVLHYHSLGISTIPLAPASKNPPKGIRWKKFQDRLPTVDELHDWHDRTDFGIAIVCGEVSGNLIVRDFDNPGAYERFRDRNPDLCRTLPAVATGRLGGVHLYARSQSAEHHDLNDGEVRGEGHYVVAPPSIHPSGVPYRWFHDLPPIPVIDDPSILLAGARRKSTRQTTTDGKTDAVHTDAVLLCPTQCTNNLLYDGLGEGIRATLPSQFGTRNACLLAFCRVLKGLYPEAKANDLLAQVQAWHAQALPTIRTKDFSVTWRDFCCAFPLTSRGGDGPLWSTAVAVAEQIELQEHTIEGRLIRLCLALHQVHGGGSFPLSCRQAAEYLGVVKDTANQKLKLLVEQGRLIRTKRYQRIERKGDEYRLVIGGAK